MSIFCYRTQKRCRARNVPFVLSVYLQVRNSQRCPNGERVMSSPAKVKKAVFPVAGLGTRFLPATKVLPKEMLILGNKPLIQHAYEEARAAGIEEFIFISSRDKFLIEDHFRPH